MKAITLYQPWATWIALGLKTIETRTHARFRNLLGQKIAIHAGQRFDPSALAQARAWCGWKETPSAIRYMSDHDYPHGLIVCTATVLSARWLLPGDSTAAMTATVGKFGLVLGDIHPLVSPLRWIGLQGIFDVPDQLIYAKEGIL
jgi:hypothetical protein